MPWGHRNVTPASDRSTWHGGGAAVVVGLPAAGLKATFEPLALAEADQRILGSNYGSSVPRRDIPQLVDLYMDGELNLDDMISARRPLDDAAQALDDLASGCGASPAVVTEPRTAQRP